MKRGLATAFFATCVAWVLWTSPAAMAKGPSDAVITGPGLADPIELRQPGAKGVGPDFFRMVEASGFFVGAWGDDGELADRPPGDLGPRYTITYTMSVTERRSDTIIQYVYPYAEPVPVTYMPANQRFWGNQRTVGAWYAARIGFKETLIDLGLPASAPSPAPVADAATAPSAISPSDGSIAVPLVIGTAVPALVLAGMLIRRHRVRRPVHS